MARKTHKRGRSKRLGLYGDEYGDVYNVYDSTLPDFSDVQSGVLTTADTSAIARFKSEFNAAVQALDYAIAGLNENATALAALESVAAQDSADYDVWQTQVSRIADAQGYIDTAQQGITEATAWMRSVAQTYNVPGLAALPLVLAVPVGIIAVIGAATIAIKTLTNSSAGTINALRIKAWEQTNAQRKAQGLEPLPPPELVAENSALDSLTNAGKFALVGILAFMIVPRLLKR